MCKKSLIMLKVLASLLFHLSQRVYTTDKAVN